jgi:hypothetical protein
MVSAGYLAADVVNADTVNKFRLPIFTGQRQLTLPELSSFQKSMVRGDVYVEVKILDQTDTEIACYTTILSLSR